MRSRTELLGKVCRGGRITPKLRRFGETTLFDQRSVMLNDLPRRFDALGVDRSLGLVRLGLGTRWASFVAESGAAGALFITTVGALGTAATGSFVVCCLCVWRVGPQQLNAISIIPTEYRLSSTCLLIGTAPATVRSFRQHNRGIQGEFPMADDNGTEREHTTVVETGGGGGGGVLAVVLLIIVVLVLLYIFRADLGFGSKATNINVPDKINVNVNHN